MTSSSILSPQILKKIVGGGALEFGPIILFLLSFHHFHIYKATVIFMVTTIVAVVCTYLIQKRIPYLALYVLFLTLIFGYMTVAHHQPRFIQIRDTIYDATCALTLLGGLMFDVIFLKLAFNSVLPMTTRAWTRVTYGWVVLFIIIAIANEYVRRTMSVGGWFEFKSGVVVFTLIFSLVELYFLYEKAEK